MVESLPHGGSALVTKHIHVDCSCLQHAVPELPRAGWCVVATDAEGDAVAGASGPVPRLLPQTAVTAEHLAMKEGHRLLAAQKTNPPTVS